jgi:cell wall-associated NlpC family hydrolase
VPLDWCPGNAAICQDNVRATVLPAGTAVNMVCWVDSTRYEGQAYPRWFYVTSGSWQGWLKAEWVTNQNPSSPYCWDRTTEQLRAVGASLEATGTSEINQVYPTSTDKSVALSAYGFNDWGPYGDWSGDCVMYVGLSWYRGAGVKIKSAPTAQAIGQLYSLNTSTNPPRGAAVFWKYGSFGHVAISLGNGMLVTTRGFDNDRLSTTQEWFSQVNSGKTYMGWTPTP